MWTPSQFKITDEKTIAEFIASVGLATLVTNHAPYPMATHTPMELEYENDGTMYLRGHIAKANPQSGLLQEEPKVLAIFQSPISHYISSSWYEKPNAPTWNYMSVHVYGKVSVLEGEALWQSVERLVKRHEKTSERPVSLATLPHSIQGMLQAVTGFEIKVDKIEAAFKLSQNRNSKDHQNIISELEKLNTPLSKAMAKALTQHAPH